jgi:import inner membrane translocase subunit TIM17
MDRQPCPHRIYDDLAIGFTMGTCMGGLFHFVKGAKNAPRGERFRNAMVSMGTRGPVIGGTFKEINTQ